MSKQSYADDPIAAYDARVMDQPGRRLRAWMRLVCVHGSSDAAVYRIACESASKLFSWAPQQTYRQLLDTVKAEPQLEETCKHLERLPLRNGHGTIEEIEQGPPALSASVPRFLQDLANAINTDIAEACEAFDDRDVWFPGVDEGIAPVTDDHVKLVIWGMQRELNRERRNREGKIMDPRLPAAPLCNLPWHIQRALVERRRLRFTQWGISREDWERGEVSFWNIQEDTGWTPVLRYEDD